MDLGKESVGMQARSVEPLEEELRVRSEQARLQGALIEMLNVELRESRRRLVEQADQITELRRLLMIRHDLLLSRYKESLETAARDAAAAAGPERFRAVRVLRRMSRALQRLVK